jgi:hypothetical protein
MLYSKAAAGALQMRKEHSQRCLGRGSRCVYKVQPRRWPGSRQGEAAEKRAKELTFPELDDAAITDIHQCSQRRLIQNAWASAIAPSYQRRRAVVLK